MFRQTARPSTDLPSVRPSRPHPISQAYLHLIAIIVAVASMAANYGSQPAVVTGSPGSCRSEHFVVQAPTTELARQVCAEAERFRRELAIEWLGHELPPWQDVCPIRVIVGPHLGAGGATSFTFINGQPRSWTMEIQGSRQRILDSVLPHEITHTIMATHFGRPLPRWADEGAATSVEHASERTKQDRLLIEFLTTNRGIAFNQMFAMKEYPRDILPLYSQGYSLARYLIARGGKQKFVAYIGDGMKWNNWTAATREHYRMRSLSELQLTWLDWVRQGSPAITPDRTPESIANAAIASNPSASTATPGRALPPGDSIGELVPLPTPVTRPNADGMARNNSAVTPTTSSARAPSDGWYSRRRDESMRQSGGTATTSAGPGERQYVGRAQSKVLLR